MTETIKLAYTSTSAAELEQLYATQGANQEVVLGLASNIHTPANVLEQIALLPDTLAVAKKVVGNPSTPVNVLNKILLKARKFTRGKDGVTVIVRLAERTDLTPELYQAVSQTRKRKVLVALAANGSVPFGLYEKLAASPYVAVVAAAATSSHASSIETIYNFLHRENNEIASKAAQNKGLTEEVFKLILKKGVSVPAAIGLISYPNHTGETLDLLASTVMEEENDKTKISFFERFVYHPNITSDTFEKLLSYYIINSNGARSTHLLWLLSTAYHNNAPFIVLLYVKRNLLESFPNFRIKSLIETGEWDKLVFLNAKKYVGNNDLDEVEKVPVSWLEDLMLTSISPIVS